MALFLEFCWATLLPSGFPVVVSRHTGQEMQGRKQRVGFQWRGLQRTSSTPVQRPSGHLSWEPAEASPCVSRDQPSFLWSHIMVSYSTSSHPNARCWQRNRARGRLGDRRGRPEPVVGGGSPGWEGVVKEAVALDSWSPCPLIEQGHPSPQRLAGQWAVPLPKGSVSKPGGQRTEVSLRVSRKLPEGPGSGGSGPFPGDTVPCFPCRRALRPLGN